TRERIEQSPKSGKARAAAITPALAALVSAYVAECVVEHGADALGFVWPGRAGRAMERKAPRPLLGRAPERAGLVDEQGRALVPFHGLRHTAASIALAADVALVVVSKQLG